MTTRAVRIAVPLLAAAFLLALPAVCAADEAADAEKKKDPAMSEDYPWPEPGRHGSLTYRERINLITRTPLRKEAPPETPREGREFRGLRDSRPLIARNVDWGYTTKGRKHKLDAIARTPVTTPIRKGDR